MIAKEKKQAIIAEYGRTTGFTGGSDCYLDRKNSGAYRAFKGQSERSSFQKRTFKDGRTKTWSAGLFKEDGYRKISFFDRTFRNQKVMSLKNRAEVYSALFL